jgi:hypothetical protein
VPFAKRTKILQITSWKYCKVENQFFNTNILFRVSLFQTSELWANFSSFFLSGKLNKNSCLTLAMTQIPVKVFPSRISKLLQGYSLRKNLPSLPPLRGEIQTTTRIFLNGEGGREYAGDGPIGGERRPLPQAPSAPVLVRRVSPPAASFRMSEVKKWSSSTSGEIWPLLREPPRAELTAVPTPIAVPTAWSPPPPLTLSLSTAEDRTA